MRTLPKLIATLPMAMIMGSALAEERTFNFNIPAQPLGTAIETVSKQTGLQPFYVDGTLAGKQSPALKGNYTKREAMEKLLAHSGLDYTFTGENTLAVKHKKAQSETTLKPMTVVGEAVQDPNDPFNENYAVPNATTATKTDTPIMETPVSIEVVPRAVMDDQKSSRIKDALENVSGVRPQPSMGTGTGFIIRGFRTDRVFRNGLTATATGNFPTDFDAGNLERIEVLKGPAAILFGRTEPGGLINVTPKRPLDIPFYSLEQQFGSYDYYRTQWDATGPITGDRSLLYRFTGSYQNSKSFRDFIFNDRILVSPSITWRPSEATDFTLNVEGLDQTFQADVGIPAIGRRPAPVPINRSFDDPNNPQDHLSKVYLGTELNHRFNDDWAFHNRFLASYLNDDQTFVVPAPSFGNALRADNRTLDRNIFSQSDDVEFYNTNLDLTGKFEIWNTRHEVLTGFDYLRGFTGYRLKGDWKNPNPALAIDIFNPAPSYGISRSLFDSTLATYVNPNNAFSMFKEQWWGVYFQDQITLWDKLHILGGGRQDWAETGRGLGPTDNAANSSLSSNVRKDEKFSPRVGILYQPWTFLSLYGNWTTSFGVNNGLSTSGQVQPPEIGEQYEAGIKTELFDRQLSGSLAYYHLTKENLLTPDLATPDPNDSIAIGQASSQGIEMDVSGRITEGLSLIGSYAFTDARITSDNSGLQGNRLNNVPEHSGSLWLRYELKDYAPLDGLSFGVGTFLAGQREGDNENTFQLPGYVRLDAFAAYRWDVGKSRVIAQLNVRNLLDKKYFESTDPFLNFAPRLASYPGAPLIAIGSVRVEY